MPEVTEHHTELSPDLDLSKRTDETPYWTIGVFVLSLGLFAWVRITKARKLQQMFKCFISPRFVKQAMREELVLSHGASIALALNFTLTAGLLLMIGLSLFEGQLNVFGQTPQVLQYLICCGLVVVVYLVKVIGVNIARHILQVDYGINEYIFNVFLFNNMLGLFLLPLLVAATFGAHGVREVLVQAAIIAAGLFYLLRLGRGVFTSMAYGAPHVYLFLYLCTLEFLPLVVIYAVFVSKMA